MLYSTPALPLSESRNEPWDHNIALLSVIVLCYNYGKYIREALQSIRTETFRDYELIILDDGSTDPLTVNVLAELRKEGIRVETQTHAGQARALNRGISEARGKYVCCLSADDTLEPTYFEKCIILLESNPGVTFAYSLVRTFGSEQRIGVTQPYDFRLLLKYNHVCGSAVFRKDSWKIVGGFDESMSAYEDWDFWIRLGKRGLRGKLIPEPLFNWRRHPETFGLRADQRRPELVAKIKANHSDLFLDTRAIYKIQWNYHDIRVPNPFINLASGDQYTHSSGDTLLVIADTSGLARRTLDFLSKRSKSVSIISVITSAGSDDKIRGISNVSYSLARLLDAHYWCDFIINLITTRSIHTVLICESKLGNELSKSIRKETQAVIMDATELDRNS